MRSLALCLALLPLACGKDDEKPPPVAPAAAAVDFKLAADPGAALSVKEAKEKGHGEEVVVVGRLSKVIGGYAVFNLVDTSLEYCGEDSEEGCETPWDYC